MSSTMRHGFSTLNRLLGKKNKDGSMSKSVSNLSTLDTTSQHNKIIPLSASTNAPFEQTYRITICLPKDQMFVVRVGAKTKLRQLLDTVCHSKQLDRDKYEFRHPDGTQTYDIDMTIGEVGLNEIRLADKNDKAYIKFNTDELMKLRHLSRESLTSSSEFSKGSTKQSVYSKTISPYSSTNSLNSMDSATATNAQHHQNYSHNHIASLQHPPVVPQRKKRLAPRPPSQNLINENTEVMDTEYRNSTSVFKQPLPLALPRQAFHASTPNLTSTKNNKNELSIKPPQDNNNITNNNNEHTINNNAIRTSNNYFAGPADVRQRQPDVQTDETADPSPIYSTVVLRKSRTLIESTEMPTPKKRTLIVATNRKKAPPAPTPRLFTVETTIASNTSPQQEDQQCQSNTNPNISKVMLNVEVSANIIEIDSRDLLSNDPLLLPVAATTDESIADSSDDEKTNIYNIRTGKPIITPNAISTSFPDHHTIKPSLRVDEISTPVALNVSPDVIIISPVNKSITAIRDASENPSRAESPLWTYTLPAPPTFADTENASKKQTIASISETPAAELYNVESLGGTSDSATTVVSKSPDVSDSDVPIKPIIIERLPLDFDAFTCDSIGGDDIRSITQSNAAAAEGDQSLSPRFSREALLENLTKRQEQFIENNFQFLNNEASPVVSEPQSLTMDTRNEEEDGKPIIDEYPTEKATSAESMECLQMQDSEELKEVSESNKLDENISSEAISGEIKLSDNVSSNANAIIVTKDDDTTENEAHFVKRSSITNVFLNVSSSRINRSDSFHSTRQTNPSPTDHHSSASINALTPRSASYISLIGTQKFENRALRPQLADSPNRRSSSELSIADSPLLQSVSVMKSILSNSRKNSLHNEAMIAVAKESEHTAEVLVRNTSITDINWPVVDTEEPFKKSVPAAATVTITKLNADPPAVSTQNATEKKWCYQGPPAIQMSTWGDRPKSKISIKTDKDYKSSTADNAVDQSHLDGTAKKETHTVESDRIPIIRGVVPKSLTQLADTFDTEPTNLSIRRPSYEISTYISDKSQHETASLGRIPIPNRWSTIGSIPSSTSVVNPMFGHSVANIKPIAAAAAAGTVKPNFSLADSVNVHPIHNAENTKNYAIAKDGSFDSGYKSMPPVFSEPLSAARSPNNPDDQVSIGAPAPFSQFTLRKTGLKEQILADSTPKNMHKKPDVQHQTTVQLRSHNGEAQKRFSVPLFTAPPKLPKPVGHVSKAPHLSNPPQAPPPPPAMAPSSIRVVRTQQSLPPVLVDSRDQLLDAIRNFGNNGGLKKRNQ